MSASEDAELRRSTRQAVRACCSRNQRIRTSLTVGGEVAVFQEVAGEALVASGVAVFEDGEGKAGEAVHMHLIRGQPGGGADGIVVS